MVENLSIPAGEMISPLCLVERCRMDNGERNVGLIDGFCSLSNDKRPTSLVRDDKCNETSSSFGFDRTLFFFCCLRGDFNFFCVDEGNAMSEDSPAPAELRDDIPPKDEPFLLFDTLVPVLLSLCTRDDIG